MPLVVSTTSFSPRAAAKASVVVPMRAEPRPAKPATGADDEALRAGDGAAGLDVTGAAEADVGTCVGVADGAAELAWGGMVGATDGTEPAGVVAVPPQALTTMVSRAIPVIRARMMMTFLSEATGRPFRRAAVLLDSCRSLSVAARRRSRPFS